jgi:hypothetical protein
MLRKRIRAAGRVRRPAARVALLAAGVMLLALMVAGPAAAQAAAPPNAKARPFMAQTMVTSVDVSGKTLTAKVIKGNRPMKASRGKDVVFAVGDSAIIVKIGEEGATTIGLGGLVAGDRVLVAGRVDRTIPDAPVFNVWLIIDRGPAPAKT